jgi:hypothetical protein
LCNLAVMRQLPVTALAAAFSGFGPLNAPAILTLRVEAVRVSGTRDIARQGSIFIVLEPRNAASFDHRRIRNPGLRHGAQCAFACPEFGCAGLGK